MKANAAISRRQFLAVVGGGAAALAFFPKIAAAAQNEIIAIRIGVRDGNKTRLVIETKFRPEYSLIYPDKQLVVSLDADGSVKPGMTEGTLITSIDIIGKKIIANLKKAIAPIPKSQILVLGPSGGSQWRLVLDFSAASAIEKTKTAAKTATTSNNSGKMPTIVIDPGHGGKDPGCIGATGALEKDVVLSVAKKLYDKLDSAGYNVHLTRKNDSFLNLDARAAIAEKKKADLFISLHANANPSKAVKGFSVYTLSKNASDAEAQKLADTENAADKIDVGGFVDYAPGTRLALSALLQNEITEESLKLAGKIKRAVRENGIDRVDNSHRSAAFAVLK
ncbi:MAG: N-acetylmuramoyl-L-alanine amidase, partial [Rickettsiales bacterium]|nr:N-acetylmuramoyl-L-alanine amidase [Rickettsiales bacterium]